MGGIGPSGRLGVAPLGGLVGVWWGLVGGYGAMTLILVLCVIRSDWARYATEAQAQSEAGQPGGAKAPV